MIKSSTIALSSECCFGPRFPASFPANCFYWFCTIISHLAFFKLINPNLHRRDSSRPRKLSDDFSNSRFCFINDTRKTPKHPLNLPRSQFFFCFLLLCCWKRKLTHRWRGRQTMCNFDISGFFFGDELNSFFFSFGEATEGGFVFIANDNDVLFSLFAFNVLMDFYKANSWCAGEKVSLR